MEKLSALPDDKKQAIINAGMSVFASAGYKKAYISEIASKAGISKALVFHYFGSKKSLYFSLVEYASNLLLQEMQAELDTSLTDFFDKLQNVVKVQMSVLQRHPFMISFITSMYFEDDPEVKSTLHEAYLQGESTRSHLTLDGIDSSKFKTGVDPRLVVEILVKYTEGVINNRMDANQSFQETYDKFEQCLALLKNNLYKEEYL